MHKKTVIFPLALVLFCFPAFAQQETGPNPVYKRGETVLEQTLPPSPEAASRVKYADVPFTHSQGLAEYEVLASIVTDADGRRRVTYTDHAGRTLATRTGVDSLTYYIYDSLDQLRAVVGGYNGTVYETSDYSAYGSRTVKSSITPPSGITLRDHYTGCEDLSPDFSLPYADHAARFYAPALHRWMVSDPKSEEYYGVSVYAYCGGNPLRYIDKKGKDLVLAGANNSSVTFTTDLVSLSVNVASIGIDWNGNYSISGKDALSAALDIAGVFDPTGIADGANVILQMSEGNALDALISAAGLIPYAGDLAKLGKIEKDIRIIDSAIGSSKSFVKFTSRNFRKNLARLTGMNPKGMQAHHILPQKFRSQFEAAGINIDNPVYGKWLESSHHNKKAYLYNKKWEDYFESHHNASKDDILKQAELFMNEVYGQ